MANPDTLNTLIELANKETDEAAKHLGAALRLKEDAIQKLDLLLQYRDDYAQRYETTLSAGISAAQINNFQVFIHKLDSAIAGQQKVVTESARRADQARMAWINCEQKKMSFVTLSNRASKDIARREIWRDQKQNDEFAARSAQRKPNQS